MERLMYVYVFFTQNKQNKFSLAILYFPFSMRDWMDFKKKTLFAIELINRKKQPMPLLMHFPREGSFHQRRRVALMLYIWLLLFLSVGAFIVIGTLQTWENCRQNNAYNDTMFFQQCVKRSDWQNVEAILFLGSLIIVIHAFVFVFMVLFHAKCCRPESSPTSILSPTATTALRPSQGMQPFVA